MEREKGAVTLEACVAVLAFVALMLILSAFFRMFMAQNLTAHALMQTAQSLSMDAYSSSRIGIKDGEIGTTGTYVKQFVNSLFGSETKSPNFVSNNVWFDEKQPQSEVVNEALVRFLGYMSGGDEPTAGNLLENMYVVNGLAGLDFSESCIEGSDLKLVLKYELEYRIAIWDIKNVEVKQVSTARLWK